MMVKIHKAKFKVPFIRPNKIDFVFFSNPITTMGTSRAQGYIVAFYANITY